MKKQIEQSLKVVKRPSHKKLIFKLRITLEDVSPKVYRVLLVPGSFNLNHLHMLIQMSFGWNDSHLHEFLVGTKAYIDTRTDEGDITGKPTFDERKFCLGSELSLGQKFDYAYDFGDNWNHKVEVVSIDEPQDFIQYPLCIEGKNACPPDDCGGVYGYEELKKSFTSKDSNRKDSALRWVGGQFDPSSCDPNRINRDMIWRHNW